MKAEPWVSRYYGIKQRCSNPNSKYYGAKGIKCLITKEELKKLWFRDKGFDLKKPTIDRIDSSGNYEYSNCRFIEREENSSRVRREITHCRRGHPLSGSNLYLQKYNGWKSRICRICINVSKSKYNKKNWRKWAVNTQFKKRLKRKLLKTLAENSKGSKNEGE